MEIQYDLCLLQEILNLTSTLQSVLVSLIQYEHYKSWACLQNLLKQIYQQTQQYQYLLYLFK